MSKFKVGDRVKITNNLTPTGGVKNLPVGTVTNIVREGPHFTSWMLAGGEPYFYTEDQFEHHVQPKFKVGDRVRNKYVKEAGVGVITGFNNDGSYLYYVNFKDVAWYGHCREFEDSLELAKQERQAIVCIINEFGKPRPAVNPFVHDNAALAAKEAERLAVCSPGTAFAVYELVSRSFAPVPPDPVATTETV